MLVRRLPKPALRAFVKVLWASETTGTAASQEAKRDLVLPIAAQLALPTAARELVLPTGTAHLAIRLSDAPLRLYDDTLATAPRNVGHTVLGGPRATFYVRDISEPTRSVGAQFHPGALNLLARVAGKELAGRHTALSDLWGPAAQQLRERLLAAESPEQTLDVLEALLEARLPKVRALHPVIAHALERFSATSEVGDVVKECGYSHRRFLTLFHDAVGLGPQQYCKVLRLQRAMSLVAARADVTLAEVALASGFADQPHLCRDFRELAGTSPSRYRRLRPAQPNHVPLA